MRLAMPLGAVMSLVLVLGGSGGVLDWEYVPVAAETGAGAGFIPVRPPAHERVIEVVDAIPGAKWNAGVAAAWLDRHTSSL